MWKCSTEPRCVAQRLFTLSLILSLTRTIVARAKRETSHSSSLYITIVLWVSLTPLKNSTFWYYCVKVILSLWGRLRPRKARVKRSHKVKITFSHAYLIVFFDTTCTKLDLWHAFLFKPVRNWTLRTECVSSNYG